MALYINNTFWWYITVGIIFLIIIAIFINSKDIRYDIEVEDEAIEIKQTLNNQILQKKTILEQSFPDKVIYFHKISNSDGRWINSTFYTKKDDKFTEFLTVDIEDTQNTIEFFEKQNIEIKDYKEACKYYKDFLFFKDMGLISRIFVSLWIVVAICGIVLFFAVMTHR